MPYPCSHFYFDIKFGNRLYSKEKRRAWQQFVYFYGIGRMYFSNLNSLKSMRTGP